MGRKLFVVQGDVRNYYFYIFLERELMNFPPVMDIACFYFYYFHFRPFFNLKSNKS